MKCSHQGKCFGACSEAKSPAEINMCQEKEALQKRHEAHKNSNAPGSSGMKEHDTVTSHTGKKVEIGLGPNDSGNVPANPFASLAQAGYLHSHPEVLGAKALKEWDTATRGKKLPYKVKKAK